MNARQQPDGMIRRLLAKFGLTGIVKKRKKVQRWGKPASRNYKLKYHPANRVLSQKEKVAMA